jgi:hypothetical protein
MEKLILYQVAGILLSAAVLMAITHPPRAWAIAPLRMLAAVGRRRTLSLCLLGALALLVSMGLTAIRRPVPAVHDEFSYLLAADTFAHGRLTNPPHPFWKHFECLHVLHQPTYASKYPPAQGAVLAAGQVLTGDPIVGVWLSTVLAVIAVGWMLQGWVSPGWALLGGLLVVCHPGIQTIWGQSYWGGNVSVLGGALVVGGYARLRRAPRARDAAIMAVGALVLANHRPFEGLLVAAPFAIATAVMWWRTPIRTLVPAALVLGAGFVFMAYYNARVTGRWTLMPYTLHEQTYTVQPVFLWQSPRPHPGYRHAPIERYHTHLEMGYYRAQQSAAGYAKHKVSALIQFVAFLATPALAMPLFCGLFAGYPRRFRIVLVALGCLILGQASVVWYLPHYSAPGFPLVVLVIVLGLRRIFLWRRERGRAGAAAVWAILGFYLLVFGVSVAAVPRRPVPAWATHREKILRMLADQPGDHLVLVPQGPGFDVEANWVANAADIDGARVVWAWQMTAAENRQLMSHFRERCVWLLLLDTNPPIMTRSVNRSP